MYLNIQNRTIQNILFILILFLTINSCGEKVAKGVDDPNYNINSGGEIPDIVAINSYTHVVELNWEAVDKAEKYEIQYGTSNTMTDAESVQSTATNLKLYDLSAGTTYYYQIRAYDGTHWTKWSEIEKSKTANYSTVVETYNTLGDSAYLKNHGQPYYDDNNIEGKDFWANRRDIFKAFILEKDNNPDILALQEVYPDHQKEDIAFLLKETYDAHLNVHSHIDAGAILWKKDKYKLIDAYDNIPGAYPTSVTAHGRYITAVRLEERNTRKGILVFDIHPPAGNSASKQQRRGDLVRRVADTARKLADKYHIPALILGDFNNYPNSVINGLPSAPMVLSSLSFFDTFEKADQRTNDEYMSNYRIFGTKAEKGKRIDYIFYYSKKEIKVSDYEIMIRFKKGAEPEYQLPLPSDHHPVRSTLHLFY